MNILTWNSQGYSADIGYPDLLSKCSVDILCLQECGKLEDSRINFERTPMEGKITKGEYKLGTRSRGYNIYNVYYYKLLGVGNERCNMAIFVKNNLHFIKAMVTYKELTQGGESWNRPLLGVELDDIYVFTSHLPSNGDKSACQSNET